MTKHWVSNVFYHIFFFSFFSFYIAEHTPAHFKTHWITHKWLHQNNLNEIKKKYWIKFKVFTKD